MTDKKKTDKVFIINESGVFGISDNAYATVYGQKVKLPNSRVQLADADTLKKKFLFDGITIQVVKKGEIHITISAEEKPAKKPITAPEASVHSADKYSIRTSHYRFLESDLISVHSLKESGGGLEVLFRKAGIGNGKYDYSNHYYILKKYQAHKQQSRPRPIITVVRADLLKIIFDTIAQGMTRGELIKVLQAKFKGYSSGFYYNVLNVLGILNVIAITRSKYDARQWTLTVLPERGWNKHQVWRTAKYVRGDENNK